MDKQKKIRDLFPKSKAEELAAAAREGLIKMATKEPTEQTTVVEPTLQGLSHKLDQLLSRMSQVEGSMINMQASITNDIKLVTSRLDQVEKHTCSVEGRQLNTENELRGIRIENGELRKKLDNATSNITKLEQTVDDLQGRMRRNMLVFKGIPEKMEGISNSWDKIEKLIWKILCDNLKMNIETIHIERAH